MAVLTLPVLVILVSTVFARGSRIWEAEPKLANVNSQPDRLNNHFLNEDKIVGGVYASYGEFPWHASVDILEQAPGGSAKKSLHCGASIINEFWLVSAAHCYLGRDHTTFVVTVGNHHWTKKDKYEQVFAVEKISNHYWYMGQGFDYDIAVIKIKPSANGKGIKFNKYVQPVRLANYETSYEEGDQGLVCGFGKTLNSTYDRSPDFLKKASVELFSQQRCSKLYEKYEFTDRMICAGYLSGGIDVCFGDSGGGLVVKRGDAYILLGIVSWGIPCAKAGYPGVYTYLPLLANWVKIAIQPRSQQ